MGRGLVLTICFAATLFAQQPKRILLLTLSAGYRHDSIPTAIDVLRAIDPARIEVTASEDAGLITADSLKTFDAVFFFTSGELPFTDAQKAALLDFVRSGKGFGGAHSATDTLYTWPDYSGLIGATFDGHPWVRKVRLDAEDPENPLLTGLTGGLEIVEEIYQFRDFSRDRVRVLLSLDLSTADANAEGVRRTDSDFASTWIQRYGQGRVFYTALGHFDGTWRDPNFQQLLRNGLLWMTGQMDAPADPRPSRAPGISADDKGPAIGNAATFEPRALSSGAIFSIFGDHLTPGSAAAATNTEARKLAGAVVKLNGSAVPLLYASPGQINAIAPELPGSESRIEILSAGMTSTPQSIAVKRRTPGILAVTADGGSVTVWAIGFGIPPSYPDVEINGVLATPAYRGPAPGWIALYQINLAIPAGVTAPYQARFRE